MYISEQEKIHIVREGIESIFWDFCNNGKIFISLGHFYPNLKTWIKKNIPADEAKKIKELAMIDFPLVKKRGWEKSVAALEDEDFIFFYKERLVKKCFFICKTKNIKIKDCIN